ncbi:MAG: hypothetical protein RL018_1380, partial [Pseudomonadota bacterium]
MATTPITPPLQNNSSNLVKGEGTGLTKGKLPATTAATASAVSNAKVKLTDVLRSDVLRVEVVDTDFVITVKPGRKILIREGALKSTIDENFSLEFSDQQLLTGTELFSQAQTSVLPSDSNWKDLITEPTVTPKNVIETQPNISAPFAGFNLTTLALGVGGLALAGGGGGGGGSSSASSSSSGTPSATPSATNAEQALQLIQNFAQLNTSQAPASPTGVPPTDTTFNTAGVQGVTLTNVAAINDALATSAVDRTSVSTAAKSQVLVDTYNAIFALADGTANNATVSQTLNTAQLALIGADLTALQNGVNPLNRLALLNSILDGQSFSGVDRISKINTL